jgi:hypothetical protein
MAQPSVKAGRMSERCPTGLVVPKHPIPKGSEDHLSLLVREEKIVRSGAMKKACQQWRVLCQRSLWLILSITLIGWFGL